MRNPNSGKNSHRVLVAPPGLYILISLYYHYREYAQSIPKPFTVRYNPYTQSTEILDSKPQIEMLAKTIDSKYLNPGGS